MYELEISREQLNLARIIDSGQVFRYEVINEKETLLIHLSNAVKVEQIDGGYRFYCTQEAFESVWFDYLDLGRDYKVLQSKIIEADSRLEPIIHEYSGMRILRQDGFEMLMTFIVSQSKSMVQIRKLVNELSKRYGNPFEYEGRTVYGFPRPHDLETVTELDYRNMKFGYRAPYLVDGVRFTLEQMESPHSDLNQYKDDELMKQLLTIKGVGNKVASCILIFGYGRMSGFPIDTWMRKAMQHMYFNGGKVANTVLEEYGKNLFGHGAGLAQQYLFEYGRRYF